MNRPAISILIPSLAMGGSERQAVALARGLSAAGRKVTVLTFRQGNSPLGESLSEAGVRQLTLPRGKPFEALSIASRHCVEERVGILHAFLSSAQAFGMALKLRNPDTLLVAAVRDTLPVYYHRETANLMYDAAVFFWSRGIDAFVFNSAQGARAKAIDPDDARVSVIPNGIDGSRFAPDSEARNRLRASLSVRAEETVVGVTANLTGYKGFPTLIDAAVLLRRRGEAFRFVVLGSDDGALGAEIRARAESLLPDGFNFLGRRPEVEKTIPGFDFACSASYTEGFSNALAEAMSCGVPCVATDVGESSAILGETGWIVPPRDAEALASALSEARSMNPAERRSRGEAARARIAVHYSPGRMVDAHLELYERLAARV